MSEEPSGSNSLANLTDPLEIAKRIIEMNKDRAPIDAVERGREMDKRFGGARGFAKKCRREYKEAQSEQSRIAILKLAGDTILKGLEHQRPPIGIEDLSVEQYASILKYLHDNPDDPRTKSPRQSPDTFGT